MFSFAQKEPKGDLEREEFSPPGGDTVRLPLRKLDAHGGPGPRRNDRVRVQGQVEAWKGTNGGFKIVKNQSLSTSPTFFLSSLVAFSHLPSTQFPHTQTVTFII